MVLFFLIFDLLALVQAAHPGPFDRADVNEHILPPSSGWMKP